MRRRLIYVIGSAIIGIITLLAIFLALIATGVIDAGQRKLIYRSADAVEVYNGSPLVCNEYSVLHGKLKEGHTASVTFTGIQSEVGESENSFSVTVLDENGADVTSDYKVECIFGTLTVSKRPVLITTGSATKVYDGTPLVSDVWSFSREDAIVAGHNLSVKTVGEQLDAGECKNNAIVMITDGEGNDVTYNYEVSSQFGDLVVTKRPLQIRSGSSSKYDADDGIPLTCDEWEIVSITKPLDIHNIAVAISGQQYGPGKSPNTIAEVLITDKETGENKNHNYDIKEHVEGVLWVKDPNSTEDSEAELIKAAFKSGGSLKDNGLSRSDTLLAKVCSEKDGAVYLRAQSYGDYTGNAWGAASPYLSLLNQRYGYNYLTGAAMRNSIDVTSGTIYIQSPYQYMLPYYLGTGTYNYDIQTSDVSYLSGRTEYNLKSYFYNGDGTDLQGLMDNYVDEEAAYRDFVYRNYLTVDGNTRPYLQQIIQTNGLDINDPEIITKVAQYIQNCAEYNLDYDRALDEEDNIVYAFLTEYQQGVCRHYASAATLLYRELGIPARYTIGAVGKGALADTWTDIPASSLHAWVEVYIDGVGWIMVEVTGGPFKYAQKVYTVYPSATYESYKNDSIELVAKQSVTGLSELTKAGYRVEVEVSGKQKGLGKSDSVIKSLIIYDSNGNDVTKDFNLKLEKGIVQIHKGQVTVTTLSATKHYDGTPLSVGIRPEFEGELLNGDYVALLRCITQITDIGQEINSFELVIKDIRGNDVTSHYRVNRECGILEVTQKEIYIVTGSAEKEYDGEDLILNEYWLKDGYELADGEFLAVVCVGVQTDIGASPNYVNINQTKIFNAKGVDVTRNYKINYELGTLKINKVVEEIPELPEAPEES